MNALKALKYLKDRHEFARCDPRLPKESQVNWREYIVLSLAEDQVRSLKQTYEEMCSLYGAWVCRREWHYLTGTLMTLERRGLLDWLYDGKKNRLYVLTDAGRDTLRCYNAPPYVSQAA